MTYIRIPSLLQLIILVYGINFSTHASNDGNAPDGSGPRKTYRSVLLELEPKSLNYLKDRLDQISTTSEPASYREQIDNNLAVFLRLYNIDEVINPTLGEEQSFANFIDTRLCTQSTETPPHWRDYTLRFLTNRHEKMSKRQEHLDNAHSILQTGRKINFDHPGKPVIVPMNEWLKITVPSSKQGQPATKKATSLKQDVKKRTESEIEPPLTIKIPREQDVSMPAAHLISDYLNQHLSCQEQQMTELSVHICKHFAGLRLNRYIDAYPEEAREKKLSYYQKSNLLVIGQTGCGKTHSIELVRDYLNDHGVPVTLVISNASSLTRSGFVGPHSSGIIKSALVENNYDVEKTEHQTIIFIDEIDKIRSQGSGSRDIAGSDVQGELLRIIQGDRISIDVDGPMGSKSNYIVDTTNILFVVAGAFEGIIPMDQHTMLERAPINLRTFKADRIAREKAALELPIPDATILTTIPDATEPIEKAKKKRAPKLPTSYIKKTRVITFEQLVQFGMNPELLGRLHKRILFNPLDKTGLVRILKEPKDSIIRQEQSLLTHQYGITLQFDEKAFETIADRAIAFKTGARALKSIISDIVSPILENTDVLDGETIVITSHWVEASAPKPILNKEKIPDFYT